MSLWLCRHARASSNVEDTAVLDQSSVSYSEDSSNDANRIMYEGFPSDNPQDRLAKHLTPEMIDELEKAGDINVIKN